MLPTFSAECDCIAQDSSLPTLHVRMNRTRRHRYYVCPSSRRGRCSVRANVRARVVEERILGALADRLLNGGAAQIRKQLALRMDELARNHHADVKDRRARLNRAEKRVANLVAPMASGEHSLDGRARSDCA